MTTNSDIFAYLCELAPLNLQLEFDNSGFLIGHIEERAEKVLVALDVTEEVVNEALELGAKLIISHHPIIFSAIKSICDPLLLNLIENGIAVISMHTNLDVAPGGVNDTLMETLGAECEGILEENGLGRVGTLKKELKMAEFLSVCKDALKCCGLRYHDSGRKVHRIAVLGGSGGDSIKRAYDLGCDTYVTSDIKYHQFLMAKKLGVNLIDGDHFCTENPVVYKLQKQLCTRFGDTEFVVSKIHVQTARSF